MCVREMSSGPIRSENKTAYMFLRHKILRGGSGVEDSSFFWVLSLVSQKKNFPFLVWLLEIVVCFCDWKLSFFGYGRWGNP
jgi:hypothetical protein